MFAILILLGNLYGIIDDRREVGGPIELYCIQAAAVMLEYFNDAGTIGMVGFAVQCELVRDLPGGWQSGAKTYELIWEINETLIVEWAFICRWLERNHRTIEFFNNLGRFFSAAAVSEVEH